MGQAGRPEAGLGDTEPFAFLQQEVFLRDLQAVKLQLAMSAVFFPVP